MSNLEPVSPIDPAAPYQGGKRLLAKTIISRINEIPHATYVEPFVGMGGIFLRRNFRPKYEVINDLNSDIVNFFRVVRHHLNAFLEEISSVLTSRSDFDRLNKTDPDTLTDIQRAARFLVLQRLAYGGHASGRTFGWATDGSSRLRFDRATRMIRSLHERLKDVVIDCLPYDIAIVRYDRPEALFYLDPPYWGHEHTYGASFPRCEFSKLANQLAELKGKFILSLNDNEEVREIFNRFRIDEVNTRYTISNKGSTRGGIRNEVLISN